MELILISFEAGKSITRGIGRGGAWKSRLFLGQMTLASLVAISGRKKVSISRAHPPSNATPNGSCPPQNRYVPRHINNMYINSYNYSDYDDDGKGCALIRWCSGWCWADWPAIGRRLGGPPPLTKERYWHSGLEIVFMGHEKELSHEID